MGLILPFFREGTVRLPEQISLQIGWGDACRDSGVFLKKKLGKIMWLCKNYSRHRGRFAHPISVHFGNLPSCSQGGMGYYQNDVDLCIIHGYRK